MSRRRDGGGGTILFRGLVRNETIKTLLSYSSLNLTGALVCLCSQNTVNLYMAYDSSARK